MVDGLENPYRTDRVADALFVGRRELVDTVAGAILERRNAVRAVMGGRGMGKSSFARQLEKHLGPAALTAVVSGPVRRVVAQLAKALASELDANDPVEALVGAAKKHPSGRVAVVLDEVEKLLRDPEGIGFLDNLQEAYKRADGNLALIVLGGTGVRDLFISEASPFLRIAGGFHTLTGLQRDEAADLIRAPLRLDVPDDLVDALWAETAGHPWLLQMFMEIAVQRAASPAGVVAQLLGAIQEAQSRLHSIAFPIWWDNLRERGRDVYRSVVRQSGSVPRAQWPRRFGDDPVPWLEVLASTGLVHLDDDSVLARGTLFQRWVRENHPSTSAASTKEVDDRLGAWLSVLGVTPFERVVVRALGVWARATVEFPAAAVRSDGRFNDNRSLQPEVFFQIGALVSLLQHEQDLTAEPEALSMKSQGRSDIKVRSRLESTQRACLEFKIFGRNDFIEAVKQVMGYAAPEDTFAAIISVDRCRRPLRPEYEEKCLVATPHEAKQDAPDGVLQPAFFTEHARAGHTPLRIWHFLVQLSGT